MPALNITANAQLQSPLFRLPRELREQIYEAVFYYEDGLHYDYTSGKMLVQSTNREIKPISLALSYTCKRLAEETKDVVLAANAVTFTTGLSKNSHEDFHGLSSIAGRYNCLLTYTLIMKVELLRHVAECVTPHILHSISRAYPDSSFYFNEPLRAAAAGRDRGCWRLQRALGNDCAISVVGSLRDALDSALKLADDADSTKFEMAALRAFRDDASIWAKIARGGSIWRPPFIPESLRMLLSWNIPLWAIPTEVELAPLEGYLTSPRKGVGDLNLVRRSLNTKWYFSAAAVAIQFLERFDIACPIKKIILEENFKSVADPQRHMQGLVPLCNASTLIVERRFGFFTTILPLDWSGIDRSDRTLSDCIYGDDCLYAFVLWVEEMLELPRNMSIVLTGGRESLQVWEFIKQAAAMQEGMIKFLEQRKLPLPSLFEEDAYDAFQYPLPCFLPRWFASVIRETINGTSVLHFEDDTGDTWDVEQVVRVRHSWTVEDWREEWLRDFSQKVLTLPATWMERLKSYEIDAAFKK
ncbi:hypothetical protein BDV96DRAFT_586947 [Lophiotrema nucula]|uniref:Uncharacterized protein n=1 Tax=Lophiotrema nucula TaxID=690887 RepID=A0A6A5YMU5_9PLEO|nr:hypothetical protein BDV96DRAFT_586947 [Lophiotrema nucula]